MAGYVGHLVHGYESYNNLPNEVKSKMPNDALRSMMFGAIVPDLAIGKMKSKTHFCVPHPKYGATYDIPDMDEVKRLFLKKDPVSLGVLSHLKYDADHIEHFILVYAKPCGNDVFENTTTGERMSGIDFFGDGHSVYGQLYQLYDKYNGDIVSMYMPKFNAAFDTDFPSSKEGFLEFIEWLFPGEIPPCGISEMDDYRNVRDFHKTLERFMSYDGSNCSINAKMKDLQEVVMESSKELSRTIAKLYAD